MAGVKVQAIAKSFGSTRVLKGVSLDFASGQFVSLVGPSGCGKTTLLRIIAGLETQDSGSVLIAGVDVSDRRAADRDVAMVFQNYALYPHMTAAQNMAVPLSARRFTAMERLPILGGLMPGVKARRAQVLRDVHEAAETLSIGHLLDRRPSQLSGGQRQRIALGRAIVRHPKVFLMDEPLSNLDAALRHETRKELVDLHRRVGVTTVYVTHDQAEAMTMSDRVAVMLAGDVLQYGTPQEVYENPASLQVASFIGSPRINTLMGEIDATGAVSCIDVAGTAVKTIGWPSISATGRAQPVTLAVRPEHLRIAATGLEIEVRHVEFLGSDVLVYGDTPASTASVILRLDPELYAEHAGRPRLTVQPARGRLLAFDADGQRLAMAAPAHRETVDV